MLLNYLRLDIDSLKNTIKDVIKKNPILFTLFLLIPLIIIFINIIIYGVFNTDPLPFSITKWQLLIISIGVIAIFIFNVEPLLEIKLPIIFLPIDTLTQIRIQTIKTILLITIIELCLFGGMLYAVTTNLIYWIFFLLVTGLTFIWIKFINIKIKKARLVYLLFNIVFYISLGAVIYFLSNNISFLESLNQLTLIIISLILFFLVLLGFNLFTKSYSSFSAIVSSDKKVKKVDFSLAEIISVNFLKNEEMLLYLLNYFVIILMVKYITNTNVLGLGSMFAFFDPYIGAFSFGCLAFLSTRTKPIIPFLASSAKGKLYFYIAELLIVFFYSLFLIIININKLNYLYIVAPATAYLLNILLPMKRYDSIKSIFVNLVFISVLTLFILSEFFFTKEVFNLVIGIFVIISLFSGIKYWFFEKYE